jgi:hypothetical protein
MSINTDAYEVDPQDYEYLGHMMDTRRFNGSTKFINAMLTLIVLLLVAAITAQINFNINMTERVASLEATMKFIEARLK